MWRLLIFLVFPVPQQSLRVDIRNSEVWLVRDSEATQLTHDGKPKFQAELSPGNGRIAYYEQCPESEACIPSIVILDLDGRRVTAFHAHSQLSFDPGPCMSILSIFWLNDSELATECHMNPSLSQLIVKDLESGRITKDLLGFSFTLSPDRKMIAHAGWVRHFSSPFDKSDYLQIDDTLIYPLRAGNNQVVIKPLEEPPKVVRNEGPNYFGIHEFTSGFYWSPDSQRIAFVDCVFDWKATSSDGESGDESNRVCSLIAVSRDGKFRRFPLAGISDGDFYGAKVSWNGPHEIAFTAGSVKKSFELP